MTTLSGSAIYCEHYTVYDEADIFAGWPANHGAWQRGDEMLVGFMRGPFQVRRSGHRIKEPFQKMQARSLDGGRTWSVETPNVDFESAIHAASAPPPFTLEQSIIRGCGIYDHGGENCTPDGGFYLSNDFGLTWHGAYPFTGLTRSQDHWCTTRTAYLIDRRMVFLSYAVAGFDDYTVCARVRPNGTFELASIVCADDKRAVCPAVATLKNQICVALRRRAIRSCWIDLFVSRDDGHEWEFASEVADTGGHNGNPPALIADKHGKRLYCAYANRTDRAMYLSISDDDGLSWRQHLVRAGQMADIGYPRLFRRADDKLVCVYYYSDHGEPSHIDATIIDVP